MLCCRSRGLLFCSDALRDLKGSRGSSTTVLWACRCTSLGLRGILAHKLGIVYRWGHCPILLYLLKLRLGQGLVFPIGPCLVGLQCCSRGRWTPWVNLAGPASCCLALPRIQNHCASLQTGEGQLLVSGCEKLARKGGLWLDWIPQALPLASGCMDSRQLASIHKVVSSILLLARGPGLRGQAGAGRCNAAGESRAAGINWVIPAHWFERMKDYKMPINIMRCLTALLNLLVLFSLVCICKGILAKGTIIVNIQKGKFWVMCPVLSWKNYIW